MIRKTPIPRVVRTKDQLRAARYALGLSTGGLARMIEVEQAATVRRWESGEAPIPGNVTQLLEIAMDFLMRIEELDERIETLQSGERLCGGFVCGNAANDITQAEIGRVMVVKMLSECALAKLTKQPVFDSDEAPQTHWYSLKRVASAAGLETPEEWTDPEELTPEAALAYFERQEGVGEALSLCDSDVAAADFVLEKRTRRRRKSKTAESFSPGRVVERFAVSRV